MDILGAYPIWCYHILTLGFHMRVEEIDPLRVQAPSRGDIMLDIDSQIWYHEPSDFSLLLSFNIKYYLLQNTNYI